MGDRKIEIPGRYVQKQEKPLGQGAMGIVYLVYSVREMRDVALKLMTEYPSDTQMAQKALEKFQREAEIAKNVRHPRVLRAIDSGETAYNGRVTPYLVFEYLREGSLQDVISKKASPWKDWELLQIADIITQAADALYYLHDQKPPIVHRDVKPGNFLISSTAREKDPRSIYHLYLCDYGIARRQKTPNDLTSDPRGTPLYMAPEQFKGHISYLSDQYSLAVMACYLLTGKLPIDASDAIALALAHEQKEPIPPSALNPERIKPGEIDDVILRALAKDPIGRYPTISMLANALHTAIGHQVNASSTQRQPRLPSISLEPFKPDEDKEDEADTTVPVNSQLQLKTSTRTQVTLPSLNLQRVLSRQLPARPTMLSWSWDGNYILCLFNSHSPILVDRNNNQWNLSSLGLSHAASWTPDPFVIVLSSKSSEGYDKESILCVCNLREIVNLKRGLPSLPTVSRDASSIDAFDVSRRRLLAVWVEDRINIYQLPRWSPSMQLTSPHTSTIKDMYCDSIGVLCWSPEGSMLAMGALNGAVRCWRLDTQSTRWYELWYEPASQQRVCSLAWSPDSRFLAVAFSSGRVLAWNALERRKEAEWKNLSVRPRSISISNRQLMTVASGESYLLFGDIDAGSPFAVHPGSWLAVWSPIHPELATLDPANKKDLIIWRA
jgi:serine/threonine protein kinase